MQYLILHKVRGSPAFDVAEKTMIGDEEGWVLCTCGYRAYPYWYAELNGRTPSILPPMPDDALDCFPKKAAPKELPFDMAPILHELTKFKRRM